MTDHDPIIQCLHAIDAQDVTAVRSLLNHPAIKDGDDNYVYLSNAIGLDSLELLEVFYAFDPRLCNAFALGRSISLGHVRSAQWLLDHGTTVNAYDDGIFVCRALQWTIEDRELSLEKKREMIGWLLERGAIANREMLEKATLEIVSLFHDVPLKSKVQMLREHGSMSAARLPGERPFYEAVVDDLLNEEKRLAYADWLDAQSDPRGKFLCMFITACQTMKKCDFPAIEHLPQDWLRMMGYEIIRAMAKQGYPAPQASILKLARPALLMRRSKAEDNDLPIGSSKLGGLPDLPADFEWPRLRDCTTCYDERGDTYLDAWCGFVGQFNCEDLSQTLAGRGVPQTGLISVFLFADVCGCSGNGLRVVHFPDLSQLSRHESPGEMIPGNGISSALALAFSETLDLPSSDECSPWLADLELSEEQNDYGGDKYYGELTGDGTDMLGYFSPTSGSDITPDEQTVHFLSIRYDGGWKIHIQINESDLRNANFDNVQMPWIDFD